MHKFRFATREVKWLFNDDIAKYLDESILESVVELEQLTSELEDGPASGDERTQKIQRRADIKKWLYDQFKMLDQKLAPFLKLGH